MMEALRVGLEQAYDKVMMNSSVDAANGAATNVITVDKFVHVLLDQQGRLVLLPSFVGRSNVFVLTGNSKLRQGELVCVVRVGSEKLFDITYERNFVTVTKEEFDSWAHQVLPGR